MKQNLNKNNHYKSTNRGLKKSPNLKNMKLTEEEYLDLQQATKLSRPTIYKALNGQEVTKANEYVVKLAYLEMKNHGIDKEFLNEKIFELDQMIENE